MRHEHPLSPPGAAAPSGPAFVGRGDDVDTLRRLLGEQSARLLTLIGRAGVGKSRLAREVLWYSEFRDRLIGFLDAAPGTVTVEPRQVASAFSELAAVIGAEARIVLLDNCDPVARELAPHVGQLLDRCPQVRIVVTSREALRLPQEYVVLVRPLAVDTGLLNYDPGSSPASRLLLASIDSHYRRMHSLADRLVLDEIVRELDGVPLALELAAAEIARVGPARALRRIKAGVDLQSPALGSAPTRHRTMHDAVEWTIGDLEAHVVDLLLRLSLFETPFDIELAYRVSVLDRGRTTAALDVLFERGLIHRVESGTDVGSCRVGATVRSYCRRVDAADPARAARLRTEFAERVLVAEPRTNRRAAPDSLLTTINQLIAVGQAERAIETIALLDPVWSQHGRVRELETVLSGLLAPRTEPLAGVSAALCRELLGLWALRTDRLHRAMRMLTAAGQAYREAGDEFRSARTGVPLAAALCALGDAESAQHCLTSSSRFAGRLSERFADWMWITEALAGLPARAEGWDEVAARIRRGAGSIRLSALNALARSQIGGPAPDRSLAVYREVLADEGLADEVVSAVIAIEGCARVYDRAGTAHHEHSARLWLAARRLRARHSIPQLDPEDVPGSVHRLRTMLGPERFREIAAQVNHWTVADAAAYSLSAPATLEPADSRLDVLTARQREIAELVATGMTNRMIAKRLNLSEWTVVNHIRQIMQKLDCRSRLHVALVVQGDDHAVAADSSQ
ncbi:LuxR C-terminal-related transcriptional regulator [Nocardia aobensis]|uniref:LuxR C-terminal-related transcriptional regulator n=1 Tax=Nocardia aobensis TaxID=257277 RepID=A0ABW6P3A4_9NOCA